MWWAELSLKHHSGQIQVPLAEGQHSEQIFKPLSLLTLSHKRLVFRGHEPRAYFISVLTRPWLPHSNTRIGGYFFIIACERNSKFQIKHPNTGDRPKGAGGASAPPRKNISACRNENRATVGTGMKVLFGQKLEVCWNQHKFINCETSLELDISKCRYLMFNSRHPYKTQQRHPQPARQRSAPLGATVHSSKCKMLRYHSFDDFVGRKIL